MVPYIILFATLLCCGFLEVGNVSVSDKLGIVNRKGSKHVYAILPVMVILFLGIFRETTVGYDSESYYTYYWSQLDVWSWKKILTDFSDDNGFYLILKIIALFTDDWWIARAILFVFTFGLYYFAICKESPYPTMSLIVFIGLANLSLMFSILRQALAGAICLCAYRQTKKGSWLKSLILILVAATIHKNALLCVFIVMLFFLKMKTLSGIKLVLLSIFSYACFFVAIPFMTLLYRDSRYVGVASHDGGYGALLFFIVVIVLSWLLIRTTKTTKDSELSYLFNLSCGTLFIQIGALQWSLLNRATLLYSIYWCILLPKLICRLSLRERLRYYWIVVALFGFMFFYQLSDVYVFVMHQF